MLSERSVTCFYAVYIFLQAFVFPDDLPVLELLLGRVALVILFFPGVVSVLPDEQHLRHHDQRHRQETAKQVGAGHSAGPNKELQKVLRVRNRKKKPTKKELNGAVGPVSRPRQSALDMAYYEAMVMMDGGRSDRLKAEQLVSAQLSATFT